MDRWRWSLLAVGLGLVMPSRAAASPGTESTGAGQLPGLVIEVYGNERPAEAEKLVGPVLQALEARGYAAGPARANALIQTRASRPGLTGSVTADDLRADIQAGYQKFLAGSFEQATAELGRSLAVLHDNPALIALDQTMQPAQRRALIGLALGQRRLGNETKATEAMAELMRTAPTVELSVREYGPEPVRMSRQVTESLEKRGRGKLTIEIDDASALIFINESFRGVGRLDTELLAGPYRVYIQYGQKVGRVYDVQVEPSRESRLVVDSALDAAIRNHAKWTGLLLPDDEQFDDRAVEYAARLGRAVSVPQVVVVGLRPAGTGLELVGTVVAMSGRRVIRQASLSVGPTTTDQAKAALGSFLAGEDATDDLQVKVQDGRPFVTSRASTESRPWKWLAASGAVASVATGVVLIQLDGTCRGEVAGGSVECPTLWDTRTAGWIAVGVGGALALTAGYLFWSESRSSENPSPIAVVPHASGVAIFASGRF